MGKPRMIILVRHAQSEGNKNRDIHQFIPDHRVKLTPQGWNQAEEAGRTLRSMLKADDTIQFFTSPYRRTRETTEGILRTLTADDPTPSPFPRHKIKVFEEPRLREQDFGNFQPCSAEMERMWQERADYGHFFYRIPNGESAADAYDRVSGFNESLWRQFGEEDFPSVCVLVTHGLMTRVFLMKWYHWSVEYFEDLRNVNHCEFIVMKQNVSHKYVLENELRTWSDLKRRAAVGNNASASTLSPSTSKSTLALNSLASSPVIPTRRWGGCVNGCNHDKIIYPRRITRKNTADYLGSSALPPPAQAAQAVQLESLENEKEDHPIASQEADHTPTIAEPSAPKLGRNPSTRQTALPDPDPDPVPPRPTSPNDASDNSATSDEKDPTSEAEAEAEAENGSSTLRTQPQPRTAAVLRQLNRIGQTGVAGDGFSDDSDYFPGMQHAHASAHAQNTHQHTSPQKQLSRLRPSSKQSSKGRKQQRKMSEQDWMEQSGMGTGARADALGDGGDVSDNPAPVSGGRCASPTPIDDALDAAPIDEGNPEDPILKEARKGDMEVLNSEEQRSEDPGNMTEQDVEIMKQAEKKGMGEVY